MENNIANNSHDYYDDDEEIINWEAEAAAIIKDVEAHTKQIFVSQNLRSSNFEIFINVQTLEDENYCIRASGAGFQIAGRSFDRIEELADESGIIFETPYALLTAISPGYVRSFASRLSQRLEEGL